MNSYCPVQLQHEHQALLATLNRVMAVAEFSPQGELLHANGTYLAMLGYTLDQVRGLHHRTFCDADYRRSAAYEEFWDRLRDGAAISDRCERRRSDGTPCWLEATYAPVFGLSGEVIRVVKMATDITERVHRDRRLNEEARRLSLVADSTDNAVIITDGDWRLVYINRAFIRMFGWDADEVLARDPIELLAPHLSTDEAARIRQALHQGQSVQREEVLRGKGDERYWTNIVTNPIVDATGQLVNTVTVFTDISRSKLHEVLQHRVLEAAARETPLTEVLEMICTEVERILSDVAVLIAEVDSAGLIRPRAAPRLPASYLAKLEGRRSVAANAPMTEADQTYIDVSKDLIWNDVEHDLAALGYVACWGSKVYSAEGEMIGGIALHYKERRPLDTFHKRVMDTCAQLCALAIEREHTKARIRQLAFYDTLTNLPNRGLLHARTDLVIAAAERDGSTTAVLVIDLDRFKQINESFGHAAGDRVLQSCAVALGKALRQHDIVGRLSGDEFVAVLPKTDAARAAELLERMKAALEEPIEVGGDVLRVTASIGVAMFPTDGRDAATLLHRADMAMGKAKGAMRGSYHFFSAEMNAIAERRLALERALRKAVEADTLHFEYQPQIALRTGALCGIEALARWTHPDLGAISPVQFIGLAEDCGLIPAIGHLALRHACRQLRDWRAAGLDVPNVSVNLSPTSFHDVGLPKVIGETLHAYGLQPCDLVIEITESVMLDEHPGTARTIGELHAAGVRLAIDDFGTGYASLSYLRRLPIHEIKLDASFVKDIEHDETARALSLAISQIATSLGLTVVAEGVESEQQSRLLFQQGYDSVQGYLYARPMPGAALGDWLAGRQPWEPARTAVGVCRLVA